MSIVLSHPIQVDVQWIIANARIATPAQTMSSPNYQIEGKPPATYNAGDVLLVPAGAIHWVKNVGSGNGAELATCTVEKGKPLITLGK